ncbi:hypothetical protein A6770_23270 [Nostoc minutum NIES-26]|uniref:Uncharacterized protein n=1 Tax=Nostoc minutum NIES-26 TaxID=1844469 RepID=A0A367QXU3_9NOSO|nr:hypothetical protein A6770_23270 [Nostoc minutum NIES-26]
MLEQQELHQHLPVNCSSAHLSQEDVLQTTLRWVLFLALHNSGMNWGRQGMQGMQGMQGGEF